jgi:nucleotide-binding universal stress UspA family protein
MFQNILVATDGSDHAKKAAEYAVELAKRHEGKVIALYIADVGRYFEPIEGMGFNIEDKIIDGVKNAIKIEGENATGQVEELAKKHGVQIDKKIVEGHPAEDILKFAEDTKADVIVIGSIGIKGVRKFLLGSVTEKVIRNSRVPVLVVY